MKSKTIIWLAMAILCCSLAAHAQSTGVPESARPEVLRRGNHVVQTGTVRDGLIEAAMKTPKDDSDRWFVSLVGVSGEAQFEQMRKMIAENKEHELRAWIDAGDAMKSPTVYQVRVWDLAGTQKGWLVGLKDLVEKYGLPLIVIQPPVSGKFGTPSTIVKTIHGTCDQKELADRIREAIVTYIDKFRAPVGGLVEADSAKPIASVAPPFNLHPKPVDVPEAPKGNPIEFPPAAPRALTIKQIKDACPDATPEFVLRMKREKVTDLEEVELQWLVEQQACRPEPVTVPQRPTPSKSFQWPALKAPSTPAAMIMGAVICFLMVMIFPLVTRLLGSLAVSVVGSGSGPTFPQPTQPSSNSIIDVNGNVLWKPSSANASSTNG